MLLLQLLNILLEKYNELFVSELDPIIKSIL